MRTFREQVDFPLHAPRKVAMLLVTILLLCMNAEPLGAEEAVENGASSPQRTEQQVPPSSLYRSAIALEAAGVESLPEALAIYQAAIDAGATGEARREAFLGIARCRYRLGRYWAAHEAIEDSFPPTFDAAAVDQRLRMQVAIARRLLQESRREDVIMMVETAEGAISPSEAAAKVLGRIVYNDPKSPYTAWALLTRGDLLATLGEYLDAESCYRILMNEYAHTPEARAAQPALARLLTMRQREEGVELDRDAEVSDLLRQSRTLAVDDVRLEDRVEEAQQARQEQQAQERLERVQFYINRGSVKSMESAEFLLHDILRLYPGTEAATQAAGMLESLQSRLRRGELAP